MAACAVLGSPVPSEAPPDLLVSAKGQADRAAAWEHGAAGTRAPAVHMHPRRGGLRPTWCIWRRVGAPAHFTSSAFFRALRRAGLERARTGRHQPAPWSDRLDPMRAPRAITFGCLRRCREAATFQSLLRTHIFRKQLSRSCRLSRRAPSCIFRVVNRNMEAKAMRLCRRLCPGARFSCLLRLRTLDRSRSRSLSLSLSLYNSLFHSLSLSV